MTDATPRQRTLRSAADLAAAGLLAPEAEAAAAEVAARYAIAVTPHVAALIDATDPADPIARQYLPNAAELVTHPEERSDPIGDDPHSPLPGLVHRYPDRVLLKIAAVCAVYCRFCFRREMVGPHHGDSLTPAQIEAALSYIAARPAIWEVILTGGDPLILSPRRLSDITRSLAAIPHVHVLRWHTRLPVVAPQRIDANLVTALRQAGPKAVFLALHVNHPRELTPEVGAACARLTEAGIALVSQTVLLKGVNDDVATLEALMRRLVEMRIKPYYLHHPDLAPGTAHFRLPLATGQALVRALAARLSGLAMPTYVLDIPGGHGKVPAFAPHVTLTQRGAEVLDKHGKVHLYRDACDPD